MKTKGSQTTPLCNVVPLHGDTHGPRGPDTPIALHGYMGMTTTGDDWAEVTAAVEPCGEDVFEVVFTNTDGVRVSLLSDAPTFKQLAYAVIEALEGGAQ